MKKSTIVIINVNARQGREIEEHVRKYAQAHNISIDIRTLPAGDVSGALDDAARNEPERIIVAGGDGTVSAAVGRLVGTTTALGIIPAGTTNNFARSLGIPLDIGAAVETAMQGNEISVTVGRIGERYFCNTVTIGVSAEAVTHTNPIRKQLLGRLEYALKGTDNLVRHNHFSCELVLDGKRRAFKTHHVIIANSSHHGGFAIAPQQLLRDPNLMVTALAVNRSRWHYLRDLVMLPLGLSKRSKHTFTATAKQIRITTTPVQEVEADGEDAGKTPIEISIAPQTVRVLVPK